MNKKKYLIILLLVLIVLIAYNTSNTVRTKEVTAFKKVLLNEVEYIIDVHFYFRRPSLNCNLTLSKEPSKEELKQIIEYFKNFCTLETINKIADDYWKSNIIREVCVRIEIGPQKNNKFDYILTSRYYKDSYGNEEDYYQTWIVEDSNFEKVNLE